MDLQEIIDLRNINSFVKYFNERQEKVHSNNNLEPNKIIHAINLIASNDYKFRPSKCSLINKMSSSKKRLLFIYPEEEALILRYLNFLALRTNLNIHKNCISFQNGTKVTETIMKLKTPTFHNCFCIKLDIENYFNSIDVSSYKDWIPPHLISFEFFHNALSETILNPNVVLNDKIVHMPHKGVMAGTPTAPLLSNLYLNDFDQKVSDQYPLYVRYADDMLIFVTESQLKSCFDLVNQILEEKKLSLNLSKTKVYQPNEGFVFLGLLIKPNSIELSETTKRKMKSKIRRQTRRFCRLISEGTMLPKQAVYKMNMKFNRKWYGENALTTEFTWSAFFFPLLTSANGLKEIDHYYQQQIRVLASGKHSKKNYKHLPYNMLIELGYKPLVSAYYNRNST